MKWRSATPWLGAVLSVVAPLAAVYLIYRQSLNSESIDHIHFTAKSAATQIGLAMAVFSLEALLWRNLLQSAGIEKRYSDALKNTALYAFFQLFMPAVAGEYAARLLPLQTRERARAAQALFALQAVKWQARLALGGVAALWIGIDQNLHSAVAFLGGGSILASAILGLLIARFKTQSMPPWIPEKWFPHRQWPDFNQTSLFAIALFKGLLYSLSFALLLKGFGACRGLWIDWGTAAAQYTLASLVPSWGMTEGLVLSGAGILAFDLLECARLPVLTASLLCWFIHTAIPGLLGSLFLRTSAHISASQGRKTID